MPNMSLKKNPMPTQAPDVRNKNFKEVALGYTAEQAVDEAKRCLGCKNHPCVGGCPVKIHIPDFIAKVAEGDFEAAYQIIHQSSSLPAVCGRVCPQENQCEGSCVLGIRGKSVAIGTLERFAADYVRINNLEELPQKAEPTGKRVAVIGCGPAGITAASDLAIFGHEVEIFEALHLPGGVLMYGIPQFRLPKEIVMHEVKSLKKLGVKIHFNYIVGKLRTIDSLLAEGFDAVFIGAGAGLPIFLGIEGENSVGVFSANEFLTRFNLMKAYDFPNHATTPVSAKHIITVGGGNVAMDSSRTALRIGAKSTLVYRRAREQMPARAEEVHHAEQEGVNFQMLTNPKRIIADENGKIVALECVKMELGEPDSSGRRSVSEIAGSEFRIPCDALVAAIGNRPNPLLPMTCHSLKTTKKGTLEADPETLQTSIPQVFAGGDIVSGAATVISAMGQAKKAVRSINRFLKGEPLKDETAAI